MGAGQLPANSPSLRAATRSLKYCASWTISSAFRISWLRSVNAWSTVLHACAKGGGGGGALRLQEPLRNTSHGSAGSAADLWQGLPDK